MDYSEEYDQLFIAEELEISIYDIVNLNKLNSVLSPMTANSVRILTNQQKIVFLLASNEFGDIKFSDLKQFTSEIRKFQYNKFEFLNIVYCQQADDDQILFLISNQFISKYKFSSYFIDTKLVYCNTFNQCFNKYEESNPAQTSCGLSKKHLIVSLLKDGNLVVISLNEQETKIYKGSLYSLIKQDLSLIHFMQKIAQDQFLNIQKMVCSEVLLKKSLQSLIMMKFQAKIVIYQIVQLQDNQILDIELIFEIQKPIISAFLEQTLPILHIQDNNLLISYSLETKQILNQINIKAQSQYPHYVIEQNSKKRIITLIDDYLAISDSINDYFSIGFQKFVNLNLKLPQLSSQSQDLYQVKNCQLCFVLKIKSQNKIISFMLSEDLNSVINKQEMNVKSFYNLFQFDDHIYSPFFYNNDIYLAIAVYHFENSAKQNQYTLINLLKNDVQEMKVGDQSKCIVSQQQNSQQQNFQEQDSPAEALSIIFNSKTQMLYGIDTKGYITLWSISDVNQCQQIVQPRYTYKEQNIIYETFLIQNKEMVLDEENNQLILLCQKNLLIRYDLISGQAFQILMNQIPQEISQIKLFYDVKMTILTVGSITNANTQFFKFNFQNLNFENIITVNHDTQRQLQESGQKLLINYLKLSDNTFKINNFYSDIVISIPLTNSKISKFQFYFKIDNTYQLNDVDRQGTLDSPYNQNTQFLYISLLVMKYVVSLNLDLLYLEINLLQNSQDINWKKSYEFYDINNQSIIFRIIGETGEQKPQILWNSLNQRFQFQSLNSVEITNVKILFSKQFGLFFEKIKNQIVLSDVEMFDIEKQRVVYRIECQTSLIINNLYIISQIFDERQRFYILSNKIQIDNLQIINCTFLLPIIFIEMQTSEVQGLVQYQNVNIKYNKCDRSGESDILKQWEIPTYLLSFSDLSTISNLEITGNEFCNLSIFQFKKSKNNIQTQAVGINLIENKFYYQQQFILWSIESFTKSNNNFKISDSTFNNNNLVQEGVKQQQIIIQDYTRINTLIIENIDYINHQELTFINTNQIDDLQIKNVICENTYDFDYNLYNLDIIYSIFHFQEVNSLYIIDLSISDKISKEKPFIYFENLSKKQISVNIINSNFTKLRVNQVLHQYESSPVFISTFGSTILFKNLIFDRIELIQSSSTMIQSATAFTIFNVGGEITFQNCQFLNSESNSKLNYLQITTDKIKVIDSFFQIQSIELAINKERIGGFIRATTQQLYITNSLMQNGVSGFGAFLYIDSYGQNLDIQIENTTFEKGKSYQDGSAFYIDSSTQNLNFKCVNCQFKNIYSDLVDGTAIKIKNKSPVVQTQITNRLYFEGGSIVNIFGNQNTKFLDLSNCYLEMVDIKEISFELENILIRNRYLDTITYPSLALLTARYSQVQIRGIKIYSVPYMNYFFKFLDCTFSTIGIQDAHINDLNINSFFIYAQYSQLILSRVYFDNDSSLIQLHTSTLTISQARFSKILCSSCKGSSVQLNQSGAIFQDTYFINCIGKHGGAIFIQNINQPINISSSLFENNYADFGGAIFVSQLQNQVIFNYIQKISTMYLLQKKESQELNIDQVKFFKNIAFYQGQAIYGQYNNSPNQDQTFVLNFKDCYFELNTDQKGPIIKTMKILPNFDQKTMVRIQNDYNGKQYFIQTNPTYLKVINIEHLQEQYPQLQKDNNSLTFNEFKSGQIIDRLDFAFFDEYHNELPDQIYVYFLPQILYNINSTSNLETNFTFKPEDFSFKEQKYTAHNVKVIGIPGGNLKMSFFIFDLFNSEMLTSFNSSQIFNIIFNFRYCKQGEQKLVYNTFIECESCGNNTYSFDAERCIDCPIGSKCNGRDEISALQGYWRDGTNSSNFLSCYNLIENCRGGSFGNNICFEGHIGALCESCDIYGKFWEKSYTKSSQFTCVRCDKIERNTWTILLSTLYAFISIIFTVIGDYRKSDAYQLKRIASTIILNSLPQKKAEEVLKKKHYIQKSEQQASFMVKILTNYFQIVSCISTFNLSLPQSNSKHYNKLIYTISQTCFISNKNKSSLKKKFIKKFIISFQCSSLFNIDLNNLPQVVGKPLEQTSKSIDCALVEISTDIPVIYLKIIFSEILPFFYMLMIILWVGFRKLICRKKRQLSRSFLSSASLFVIFFVYPDIVDQLIALISCRKIGEKNYIVADVSYQCYTEQHIKYIVQIILPLLLLWLVFIPVGLFLRIRHFRTSLNKNSVKRIYGFLYREYSDKSYYWEFIKIIQKITIILVLNLFFEDTVVKGFLILIIIFSYGQITSIVQPYKDEWVNQQDRLSTIICFATVFFALFTYKNPYLYLIILSYIAIVIINLFFLIRLIKPIIKFYYMKLKFRIKQILIKIPILKKYFNQQQEETNLTAEEKEKQQKRKNIFRKVKRSLTTFIQKPLEQKRETLKMIQNKYLSIRFKKSFQNIKIQLFIQIKTVSDKFSNESGINTKNDIVIKTQLIGDIDPLTQENLDKKNKKFTFGDISIKLNDQQNLSSPELNNILKTKDQVKFYTIESEDQPLERNRFSTSSPSANIFINGSESNNLISTLIFSDQIKTSPSNIPYKIIQKSIEFEDIFEEVEEEEENKQNNQ